MREKEQSREPSALRLPKRHECSVTVEDVTLNILTDAEHVPQPGMYFPLHTHAYSELFYCISGTITFRQEKGEISLSAGDILIAPAGYRHILQYPEDGSLWDTISFFCTHHRSANARSLYPELERLCFGETPFLHRSAGDICAQLT